MNSNLKLLPAALLVAVLALAGCGGGSDTPAETEPTPEELAAQMQMQEATDAISAANMAALALSNSSDDAAVMAAEAAIQKAKTEIADLPEADQAGRLAELSTAETVVSAQRARLTAEADAATAKAEQDRLAAEEAERKAEEARKAAEAAAAAMAATAAKLYAGISVPSGEFAADGTITFAITDRAAGYNEAGTQILLSIGEGDTPHTEVSATLSEDKDTVVATLHGWAGKRYADPAGGDMYEAVVYSNVEAPTQGRKFGAEDVTESDNNRAFQYDLTSGALTQAQLTAEGAAARIALTGVTRTAGTETFELPDPNPNSEQIITVSGSFHGVSGTYSCDTGTARDAACTAAVAEKGFTLAGTWTFKPSDANARVMSAADTEYASYGWWLKKTANDATYTASAFVDEKGTVAPASGLNDLNGMATYQGGAAGKYALASSTGGTNDAGHFTARATLEANFTSNTEATAITGTIDNFTGADGRMRDWEVALNGSTIGDTGAIGDTTDGTVWTIGGKKADASGQWSGNLRNNGTDLVPQVATGTFYSHYGDDGRMVGAFGANKQ